MMKMVAWQRVKDGLEDISPIVSDMWPMEMVDGLYHRAKVVQRICYQNIHTGSWSEVPMVWRDAYQATCLLLGVMLIDRDAHHDAIQEFDKGLLLGGNIFRSRIHSIIEMMSVDDEVWPDDVYVTSDCEHPGSSWQEARTWQAVPHEVNFHDMALDTFLVKYLSKHVPVLVRGLAREWPACTLWNQKSYWKNRIAAARTVPVEIGQDYMAADWTQQLMPFVEFLERMEEEQGKRVYLAQHDLFDQIPRLAKDIVIPDYCTSPHVQRRIWIGPAGTKTPIHHDPYENIFCQIVGYKYILLYPPEAAPYLELDISGMAPNTSTLDIDDPGSNKIMPHHLDAMHTECILGPGDALYIPQGWYHFIKSLTTSFSVSFWWEQHHMEEPDID